MKTRKPSANYIAKQIAQLQSENKRLLADNVDILYEAVDFLTEAQTEAAAKYRKNAAAIESNHSEIIRLRGLR